MSHGNGSSAFIFQVTGILKPVTDSTDKMLQLFMKFQIATGRGRQPSTNQKPPFIAATREDQ